MQEYRLSTLRKTTPLAEDFQSSRSRMEQQMEETEEHAVAIGSQ
jgi:hypothetical protein